MAGQQKSFNPVTDNPPLLTVWHLKKAVTRLEVLPSVTCSECTDVMTLYWLISNSISPLSNYNGFERSKGESARYCWDKETRDFNNASETWNKEGPWKWGKPKNNYGLKQHWTVNHLWFKKTDGPITIVNGIRWRCEGHLQVKDIGRA